jgi:hypothetical protein
MLGPCKSARDYEAEMERYRKDNSSWGGPVKAQPLPPSTKPRPKIFGNGSLTEPEFEGAPAMRIAKRIRAHYGLSEIVAASTQGPRAVVDDLAQRLLDKAKGDEQKVQIISPEVVGELKRMRLL